MDYGCGIGSNDSSPTGIAQSPVGGSESTFHPKCLDVAAEKFGSFPNKFVPVHEFIPREEIRRGLHERGVSPHQGGTEKFSSRSNSSSAPSGRLFRVSGKTIHGTQVRVMS
jgi:hypothetical protein